MMYQHQIDECIFRAMRELRICNKYHRTEDAEHVQRRIQSLKRLKCVAPYARMGKAE